MQLLSVEIRHDIAAGYERFERGSAGIHKEQCPLARAAGQRFDQAFANKQRRVRDIESVGIEHRDPVAACAMKAMPRIIEDEEIIFSKAVDQIAQFVVQTCPCRIMVEQEMKVEQIGPVHLRQHVGELAGVVVRVVDFRNAAGRAFLVVLRFPRRPL